MEAVVANIGNWLLNSYQLFVTSVLDDENEPGEADTDSEGVYVDFPSLVAQVLENSPKSSCLVMDLGIHIY